MKHRFADETQVEDAVGTDLDALFYDPGQREQPRHDQDENCQVMLFNEHNAIEDQEACLEE